MNLNFYGGWFGELWNSGADMRLYIIVLIMFIPIMILGIFSSIKVESTFRKYSGVESNIGLTAAEVARRMLDENNLQHVMIQPVAGSLTDHYNPKTEVVSLSEAVYYSKSVAALGVACHECGHAVQHDKNYVFAKVRTWLVPVVNFSNRLFMPIIIIGLIFGLSALIPMLGYICVLAGFVMFSLSSLFCLITLPTEFNASSRAQNFLKTGFLNKDELKGSRRVLSAAALTYIASFLASLLQTLKFLALLLFALRKRRR